MKDPGFYDGMYELFGGRIAAANHGNFRTALQCVLE